MEKNQSYAAFAGVWQIAAGSLAQVAAEARTRMARGEDRVLVFDDATGHQVDLPEDQPSETPDPRAACQPEHAAPLSARETREVTLLARHWQWLEAQPAGASGSLRRLVEQACKAGLAVQRAREAREAAGRFMWVMTGNLPGFEEASRALFAKDQPRLEQLIADWPLDVRGHVEKLSREALRLDAAAR